MNIYCEIFKNSDGLFKFRLVSKSCGIIQGRKTYFTFSDCKDAVKKIGWDIGVDGKTIKEAV